MSIKLADYERFQRAREFTMANRQNSFARGFINKFKGDITTEDIERILELEKHGTAHDVKEYITENIVRKPE